MKTRLFFAFCFFLAFFPLRADEFGVRFECRDEKQVLSMIDTLLSMGTRHYDFKEIMLYDEGRTLCYCYLGSKPESPDSVGLVVAINKRMEGANPDLEIAGAPLYEVKWIRGVFLDIFPIYQMFDPDALPEELTKKKRSSKIIPHENGKNIYDLKYLPDLKKWIFLIRRF